MWDEYIMVQFNIHAAKAHLSALIQKAMLGEEVIIAKDNKPVVKLIAFHAAQGKRYLGSAKGLIKISADFNKPLEDFKDYTE
jgi:prevent-host-death family protein